MARDVCIVHIEDEFLQMKTLASRMKDYVEQYHNREGDDCFTTMSETLSTKEGDPTWIVYDIKCPKGSVQKFRYIFVGPNIIPEEVEPYLLENCHFIIDVLRPAVNAQGLFPTGGDSIRSAKEHGASDDRITIFTASQGTELQRLTTLHPHIRVISKADRSSLYGLLSKIVVQSMSDG